MNCPTHLLPLCELPHPLLATLWTAKPTMFKVVCFIALVQCWVLVSAGTTCDLDIPSRPMLPDDTNASTPYCPAGNFWNNNKCDPCPAGYFRTQMMAGLPLQYTCRMCLNVSDVSHVSRSEVPCLVTLSSYDILYVVVTSRVLRSFSLIKYSNQCIIKIFVHGLRARLNFGENSKSSLIFIKTFQ